MVNSNCSRGKIAVFLWLLVLEKDADLTLVSMLKTMVRTYGNPWHVVLVHVYKTAAFEYDKCVQSVFFIHNKHILRAK